MGGIAVPCPNGGQMLLKRSGTQITRRSPRQLLNTSVRVFREGAQMDALGINLSDGGMCLFTVSNLPIGSQVEVEFRAYRSRQRVRRRGTIRHRAVYLYGIEWLPEPDQRHGSLDRCGHSPSSHILIDPNQ